MEIRSERDKRNYIILALCAILVVIGVGYAAFSSLLTINGTANISNSWCLGFDNTQTSAMQISKGVETGTQPTGSMTYSGTACGSNLVPTSSLEAHFYQPGDQIEYTLTIMNKSTVTAAIKSILVDNESVTSNKTITKGNITYIVEMPEDVVLAPNASTTMKVIAKFQNDTPVTGNVNGETKTIEVKINAEQDDGTGGMNITPAAFTGAIYRWSKTNLANKDSSSASSYPYSIANLTEGTDYVKNATLLNKTYYLKHDVVEDEITASYVCFVYNNAEHCLKGGDGEESFATNTQIIQEYKTFYGLGDYNSSTKTGCTFNSSTSYCRGGGFNPVGAVSDGYVYVNVSLSEYCLVDDDGFSRCDE